MRRVAVVVGVAAVFLAGWLAAFVSAVVASKGLSNLRIQVDDQKDDHA